MVENAAILHRIPPSSRAVLLKGMRTQITWGSDRNADSDWSSVSNKLLSDYSHAGLPTTLAKQGSRSAPVSMCLYILFAWHLCHSIVIIS